MTWLARLPLILVQAHLTMLPRLEAEASIAHVNQTAIGSGHCNEAGVRALTAQWTHAAAGVERDAPGRPMRRDPAELQQFGFMVRKVPRQPTVVLTDGL